MFRISAFAVPPLVLLLSGTAVSALTADEVWTAWKDGGMAMGLTVSAATEAAGDGELVLNGVSLVPPGAPAGLTISDLTMTENDDGSVTITPGAAIGVDMSEGANSFKLDLVHDGLELVASEGEGGGIVYDFAAATANIVFDAKSDGYSFTDAPAQQVTNKGSFGFTDLAGVYADTPGENRTFSLSLEAAKLAYDTLSDDPNMPMKSTSVSETDGVTLDAELVLPSTIALTALQTTADFGTALQEGLSLSLAMTNGASTGSATAEDEFFPFDLALTSEPAEAVVLFNKDALSITSAGAGLTIDGASPMLPAPIKITSGAVGFDMLVPVMSGDVAADYKLVMALEEFAMNDELWAMFDPGAALQRTPLNLVIDASGKTKIDLIAMGVASETGAPPPIPAPESLTITSVAASVAGAALEASGAFTFDNSMGMPMPLGAADVAISGATQLIDGLIAIGALTEEDAMGAKMMMGAFMVPGAEPDSLTSKIEAKEGFAIFVNGQQVQ